METLTAKIISSLKRTEKECRKGFLYSYVSGTKFFLISVCQRQLGQLKYLPLFVELSAFPFNGVREIPASSIHLSPSVQFNWRVQHQVETQYNVYRGAKIFKLPHHTHLDICTVKNCCLYQPSYIRLSKIYGVLFSIHLITFGVRFVGRFIFGLLSVSFFNFFWTKNTLLFLFRVLVDLFVCVIFPSNLFLAPNALPPGCS